MIKEALDKTTALIKAPVVFDSGISVMPEESEYRWHADIEGWLAEKREIMSIAQALADKAKLEKWPRILFLDEATSHLDFPN